MRPVGFYTVTGPEGKKVVLQVIPALEKGESPFRIHVNEIQMDWSKIEEYVDPKVEGNKILAFTRWVEWNSWKEGLITPPSKVWILENEHEAEDLKKRISRCQADETDSHKRELRRLQEEIHEHEYRIRVLTHIKENESV